MINAMKMIKNFLTALLGDDEKLVIEVFGKGDNGGELIPGAAPTVQKMFYLAHKDELVAAAKEYRAKKAAKKN